MPARSTGLAARPTGLEVEKPSACSSTFGRDGLAVGQADMEARVRELEGEVLPLRKADGGSLPI